MAQAPAANSSSAGVSGERTPPRTLVIVPAFNEAASIAQVVAELRQHLPECQVLVIDDGSTDATARSVPADATLIRLPFNLGIGGAMQAGYRYALLHDFDAAIQVDADGQHPPAEARRLIEYLQAAGADMVVGSRFLSPGFYEQSSARMAGIRVLRGVLLMLTGKYFSDCTSGFRAVNRSVIRAFSTWYPDDYPEPEVVLLLHRAGFKVLELPAKMRQRQGGRTSIPLFRGLFYVVKVSLSLVLDTVRHPWPGMEVNKR